MTAPQPEAASAALFAVEIRTRRWEQMVAWYRGALGLRVLLRVVDDGYALLSAGPARIALLSRDDPGGPSPRISLALEVDDLEAAAARLRENGAEFEGPHDDPEGYRFLSTADPDGNRLKLFAWNQQ